MSLPTNIVNNYNVHISCIGKNVRNRSNGSKNICQRRSSSNRSSSDNSLKMIKNVIDRSYDSNNIHRCRSSSNGSLSDNSLKMIKNVINRSYGTNNIRRHRSSSNNNSLKINKNLGNHSNGSNNIRRRRSSSNRSSSDDSLKMIKVSIDHIKFKFSLYFNGSIILYNLNDIYLPIRLEIYAHDQDY
ncbi:unnamed protein product, partial [Rotaria sordida]